jgi:hypothetical protein
MAEVDRDKLAKLAEATDHKGQEKYMEAFREMFQSDALQSRWESGVMREETRAKTHIFCVMARGFEDAMGKEEGRKAVRATRQKQGEMMGKAMAGMVKSRGGKLNLNNFFEEFWKYFAWSPKCDITKEYDEKGNWTSYTLRVPCPIGEYLRENAPDEDFSLNYCDLDEFIAKAYNPNIRYHRRLWVPAGDLYCEITWSLDSKDIL